MKRGFLFILSSIMISFTTCTAPVNEITYNNPNDPDGIAYNGGVQNSTFSIAYDSNGSTSGSMPVDSSNYQQGQTVTVLGNTGNLVKTGYSYIGWNTQADGNGTTYTQGQTFVMGTVNVTLYAKWTTNPTYTVTYNGNGNTGGSVPIDTTNYEQGQTVTVFGNTGNLVKTGYSYIGWNTQADGNGTTYTQGQTFVMGTVNVTLYAKWNTETSAQNADLVSLTVSKGVLQPAFNSGTTSYLDAPIPYTDATTTITPTVAQSGATVKVNGTAAASGSPYSVNGLIIGSNSVSVEVTAPDGITKKTYTVNIYRALPVFKTGQTTSYATGDDGALQRGVAWPTTRFINNADGTVTDAMTGLMWLQNANIANGGKTWADALTYINTTINAGTAGYTDWRLPNARELRSLINYGQSVLYMWLNGQQFSNVQNAYYLTSTTYAMNTGSAWRVDMYFGYDVYYETKTVGGCYIWPVRRVQYLSRTGQSTSYATGDDGNLQKGNDWPNPRFFDNGNGTITDNMTTLVWLQNANNAASTKTWADALTYITSLNAGGGTAGYTDWRLPNVNELETLIHYQPTFWGDNTWLCGWLNNQGFRNVQNSFYWTSTTLASDSSTARIVNILDGTIGNYYKTNTSDLYVWPVRGGQ